ncbi:MAG: sigma 54-interacting transcriptional regulator [Lentisphaerota bacterium]
MTEEDFSELDIIHHVSHTILVHKRNISLLMNEVFDVLQRDMNLQRGALTLKRDNSLIIEASIGLSAEEKKRGQYKIGEGITGRVGGAGEGIIIPDIAKEPAFLSKTKTKRSAKTAFICVPIKYQGEVIGTLSIDHPSDNIETLNRKKRLLEIVANITAEGVAVLRSEIEEREQLQAENTRLKSELEVQYRPDNIIGNCKAMRMVYNMINQVAKSQATVLIRGESGTGKELVARAIHYASPRRHKPFIAVNCAALPENLIESELFGHEKGAFTGANVLRIGRFELANDGTLFLDEIGDISVSVQVKLLRVLQERTFERVGGSIPIRTNVRIIAATSRNLEDSIKAGRFREDLYYRLNVFPVLIPALRDRKSDIILLTEYFLEKYNKIYTKDIKRISTPAINMLMSYHWPGNVRELENCMERAVLVNSSGVINAFHLPPSLQTGKESQTSILKEDAVDFRTMVMSFEKELIVEALKNNKGNIAAVARGLQTTQRILHYKMLKLGIESEKSFKE